MKAIIFGACGQDGFYLSKLLAGKNIEVVGVGTKGGGCLVGDVSDFEFVSRLVKEHQPDYVFHLAAVSSTNHEYLFENHKVISGGALNILESVKLHCPESKVFLSGSALQFKNDSKPISENSPFEASSHYAVARIQSVYAGRYFRERHGLKVYVGYFFNHDSPLRTERHINKKITESVKRIASGSEEKIEIGDVKVRKEFNFAGDIVEAIWLLVNQADVFEAVIGCGETHTIEEFVDYCFKKIGKDWHDYVLLNNDYMPEYSVLASDPKLIMGLGWSPKINFYQLADLMLE